MASSPQQSPQQQQQQPVTAAQLLSADLDVKTCWLLGVMDDCMFRTPLHCAWCRLKQHASFTPCTIQRSRSPRRLAAHCCMRAHRALSRWPQSAKQPRDFRKSSLSALRRCVSLCGCCLRANSRPRTLATTTATLEPRSLIRRPRRQRLIPSHSRAVHRSRWAVLQPLVPAAVALRWLTSERATLPMRLTVSECTEGVE